MRLVRSTAIAACLGWLLLTTAYGAAAAEPQVDLGGSPLPGGTGSTDDTQPTVLGPGLWADTLPATNGAGTKHYYRYDRRMLDSTVHVGVIGASGDDAGDNFDVTLLGPDKDECDSGSATTTYDAPRQTFGISLWAGSSDPTDHDEPCLMADHLDIVVAHSGPAATGDLPIAIKVVEEAPADATSAEKSEDSPSIKPGEPPAGGDQLTGATSYADAPLVRTSGGSAQISTKITQGEEQLFRVPLTWGQQLTVDGLIPKLDEETEEERCCTSPGVSLQIVGPVRDSITDDVYGTSNTGDYTSSEQTRISTATPPLRYLNRYADQPAIVPGDYWISLAATAADPDLDLPPLDIPVDLEITVSDEGGGAPTYPQTVQAPDTSAGPAGYRPGTPFLIGDGDFSAVASGAPLPPEGADDGWWSARRYAGLALVLAGAASCAAGLWRLRPR